MTQDINGATRLICLFGDPVAHSKSPHLHNRAFERAGLNYAYMAFRVPGEDMKQATDAIRLLNMRGCNLTMPNKIAVIPFLDKLDPIAEMVGAVNTIVNEDGVLTGYSTDGYGFMKSFEEHGVDAKGKKMVLMGMGGAGTPIAAQAALDGVGEIVVFSPSTGKSWDRVAEEVASLLRKPAAKSAVTTQTIWTTCAHSWLTPIFWQTPPPSAWASSKDGPLSPTHRSCIQAW